MIIAIEISGGFLRRSPAEFSHPSPTAGSTEVQRERVVRAAIAGSLARAWVSGAGGGAMPVKAAACVQQAAASTPTPVRAVDQSPHSGVAFGA